MFRERGRILASAAVMVTVSSYLVGCVPADDRPSGGAERDSAGIAIMDNTTPVWRVTDAWSIDPEPVLEVGADPADTTQQFLRLFRAVALHDGGVAVINHGTNAILVFDGKGRFEHYVGRPGEGPGEYSRLTGVLRCGADTLVVNDAVQLITYSPTGKYIRTSRLTPIASDGRLGAWGVASDCRTFLLSAQSLEPAPLGEVSRRPVTLFWADPGGGQRDTVGLFPTVELETRAINGMSQGLWVPWATELVWAVAGDRLYIGSSDVPEIRVYEHGPGLVRIVRWIAAPEPITADDRRLYEEKRRRWLRTYPGIAEVMPPLSDYAKLPDRKPFFRTLLVDDEGNMWLRHYPVGVAGRPDRYDFMLPMWDRPVAGDSPEKWSVFGPNGRLLGVIDVPPDIDVRAVHGGRLIGIWKDALAVERIRWYPVVKKAR